MDSWTLEKAKNGFSEVVRRALDHQPQLVTRGRRANDAVVVIARDDYERLVAPANLVDFLRDSPLAEAVADGAFGGAPMPDPSATDPFARPRDLGRDVQL
jgi:prevent-host-death family protein